MDYAEAYDGYAAQGIPRIDVEIVKKSHFRMETSSHQPVPDHLNPIHRRPLPCLRCSDYSSTERSLEPFKKDGDMGTALHKLGSPEDKFIILHRVFWGSSPFGNPRRFSQLLRLSWTPPLLWLEISCRRSHLTISI